MEGEDLALWTTGLAGLSSESFIRGIDYREEREVLSTGALRWIERAIENAKIGIDDEPFWCDKKEV